MPSDSTVHVPAQFAADGRFHNPNGLEPTPRDDRGFAAETRLASRAVPPRAHAHRKTCG